MAKSLRSKRKRKMRALKREKNAPRELEKLKKILGVDGATDEEMKDLYKRVEKPTAKKSAKTSLGEDSMDIDVEKSKYDPKTKLDENGQYAPWVNKRTQKQMKRKRLTQKTGKKTNKLNKWQTKKK